MRSVGAFPLPRASSLVSPCNRVRAPKIRESPLCSLRQRGAAQHDRGIGLCTAFRQGSDAADAGKAWEKNSLLGGAGGNNGSGGGGDGSNGDGPDGDDGPSGREPGSATLNTGCAALLAAANRTADSFPADFAAALHAGKVTADVLKRYLAFESNFLAKLVWGIQGFRERLLADPSFPMKLLIECGLGLVTKLAAERTKRKDDFWREIDFVCANVTMTMIADFVLTWLPAPTLSYTPKIKASNALVAFFAGCPDNAFQKVQPGMDAFSLAQRAKAILRNGLKLFGVGFCASLLGVGLTNLMQAGRQLLDPAFVPGNKPQSVLATSACYGTYTSISSNLRYQLIAGVVEERGIETLFRGSPGTCHLLSVAVRTANTFVGSLLWVDFVRLCGMQKAPGPPAAAAPAPAPA